MMMQEDTICAVSTAPGTGGIAVIRVSGKEAVRVTGQLFHSASLKSGWECQQPNTASYGEWIDNSTVLDEVLVTRFIAPHSFTGEDTVEISCHGSMYIQQQILQSLIRKGCRPALPGEFTQRAFLNGKMDLSQAEAIADLIASSSAATHRLALNQMRGGFSTELAELRTQLLNFASLVELELDFSEEEVEFANREQLVALSARIEAEIQKLADSFSVGNVLKNGLPVAIIGETNAGKSTLLNCLLHEERALVSEIHGTTRDVIEDTINLQGTTFRFIDTAGIRNTRDKIESMGIERTYRKLDQAAVVLWVIDSTRSNKELISLQADILPKCKDKKLIIVFNKVDRMTASDIEARREWLDTLPPCDHLFISAARKDNLPALEALLVEAARLPETGENDVIVTNARHYEALLRAHDAILRVKDGLQNQISGDFLAQDIRECMYYLGEITGQISTDEILGNIFGKFCIGK